MLQQLRFLVIKNLASLLPPASAECLQLYGEAVQLASGDGMLWHKFADVAAHQGLAGLARYALEAGSAALPTHTVMLEKLLQVGKVLGLWGLKFGGSQACR